MRNKQSEWGCLHWFILGFMILGLLLAMSVLVISPVKG